MIGIIKKTVLLMAVAFCSASAYAQGPWTSGGTTVTLSGSTLAVTVSSVGGAMDDYTSSIPAAWNTETFTSVVIGPGVTSIGNYAFYGVSSLTSVTFPSTLTTIGSNAFRNTSLTSVTFPSALTSIGNGAFRSTDLTAVDLSGTKVTTIGNNVFNGCTDLETVTFPAALTSIGDNAFRNTALTAIEFPAKLTSIGDNAFYGCADLESVTSLATLPPSAGTDAFLGIDAGATLTVPASAVSAYSNSVWGSTAFPSGSILAIAVPPPPVTPPPPTPSDPVTPSPSLRQVTLPATSGITTEPGAGTYYVPSGEDFVFTVIPSASQSSLEPDITDSRTPSIVEYTKNDDGTWTVRVKYVQNNIALTLKMSVGNEAIDGNAVWSSGRQLYITSVTGGEARIYGITGALAKAVAVAVGETQSVSLPAGVYVVVLGGKTYKAIVK